MFAGYSYLNVDTNGLASRQSLNGWEASLAINVNRWLAGEGDFSGNYGNNIFEAIVGPSTLSASAHDYMYLGGPRVNLGPAFIHALVGGDTAGGNLFGLSLSETSFAAAFGGGIQSKVFGGHWAVRSSVDYVLTRHSQEFLFGGERFTQNNFRVGGGIVYMFGSFRRR